MKEMNLFTPAEFVENFTDIGAKKSKMPMLKMIVLSVLSGIFIALGGIVANTASHAITNTSVARLVGALTFPVGLIMSVLTGAELFTGNCLITISVLSKRARLSGMLRNLVIVFFGNFAGAILLAFCCARFGQFDMSGGALAVHMIKIASAKSAMPFWNAFTPAIFTNVLVCVAVMCASSAKDVAGRALGAFVPIFVFVICGFEHSVANMYFVPAGLFAANIPEYAQLAANAGIDVSALNWVSFFVGNLLPVTLGNVLGGVLFSSGMWYCYGKKR